MFHMIFSLWCSLSYSYFSLGNIVRSFHTENGGKLNCSLVSLAIGDEHTATNCGIFYAVTLIFTLLFVFFSVIRTTLFDRLQIVFFLFVIDSL